MRVCWIVDNKYRDLHNLFILKKNLKKIKINLIIINKFNCLEAIDLFKPKLLVIPKISKLGIKISDYARKKNIKIILVNCEGFVTKKKHSVFYPDLSKIKYLSKIFCSSYAEKNFLLDNKFKNKILMTGSLKYSRKIIKSKSINKITKVGIVSTSKYLSSRFSKNIIKEFYHRKDSGREIFKKFVNYELAFLDFLEKIKKQNNNIKFIIRPHPLEDKSCYMHLNLEIDDSKTVDDFLNKVDLIINDYSTLSVESIINGVPVLNARNLISEKISELNDYFPAKLGFPLKSMDHLNKILNNKPFKFNKILNNKKDFNHIKSKLPIDTNAVNIMCDYFKDNYETQKNYFSIVPLINFIIREIKVLIKIRSGTVNRFYNLSDQNLLQRFSN